jgi:hypothetical protein
LRRQWLAALFVAMAIAAVALASCGSPTSCVSRGSKTLAEGIATYTRSPPGQAEIKGTVGATVVVYDATPGCWYPGMQFKLEIGSCSLWVAAPSDAAADESEGGGDGGYVSALVVQGGPCELPVSTGTVTVTRLTGTFDMSGERLSWSFMGT